MEKTLLKDIPKNCPECDTILFGSAPRPKIAKSAWIVGGIGVLATGIWLLLFFTFSEVYFTPNGERGF